MKYFIFTLRWSQTDHTKIIIQAATKMIAQDRADRMGARYAECEGEADMLKA